MNTTAIAQHLNIATEAIIKIEEWATVLWVKFRGGCRFVSKKILKSQPDVSKASPEVQSKIKNYLMWAEKGKIELAQRQLDTLKRWLAEPIPPRESPIIVRIRQANKEVIEAFLDSLP